MKSETVSTPIAPEAIKQWNCCLSNHKARDSDVKQGTIERKIVQQLVNFRSGHNFPQKRKFQSVLKRSRFWCSLTMENLGKVAKVNSQRSYVEHIGAKTSKPISFIHVKTNLNIPDSGFTHAKIHKYLMQTAPLSVSVSLCDNQIKIRAMNASLCRKTHLRSSFTFLTSLFARQSALNFTIINY